MAEIKLLEQSYSVNNKKYILQNDFTFEELDWLDVVYNRLTPNNADGKNEIKGSFTRDEIKKTLKILLKTADGSNFTDEDFLKTRESMCVKIIADFFLWRAVLGYTMQNIRVQTVNSGRQKRKQPKKRKS